MTTFVMTPRLKLLVFVAYPIPDPGSIGQLMQEVAPARSVDVSPRLVL